MWYILYHFYSTKCTIIMVQNVLKNGTKCTINMVHLVPFPPSSPPSPLPSPPHVFQFSTLDLKQSLISYHTLITMKTYLCLEHVLNLGPQGPADWKSRALPLCHRAGHRNNEINVIYIHMIVYRYACI